MPIYDYACTACGHLVEVVHGIDAHGPRFCPSCGADGSMRKTIAAPAIVFKGAGWAKKDCAATATSGTKRGPGKDDAATDAPASGTAAAEASTTTATAATTAGGGD